jgi:hypothetical protein
MKRWDKSLEGTICDLCNGSGQITTSRDLHRSGGIIPCPRGYFNGHGFPCCIKGNLSFSRYDLDNWVKLKRKYPQK